MEAQTNVLDVQQWISIRTLPGGYRNRPAEFTKCATSKGSNLLKQLDYFYLVH